MYVKVIEFVTSTGFFLKTEIEHDALFGSVRDNNLPRAHVHYPLPYIQPHESVIFVYINGHERRYITRQKHKYARRVT